MSRKFGPKTKDHPSCNELCIICGNPMKEGEYTGLVAMGPGDDKESQERANAGRPYNAVAKEVHWDCMAPDYKEE